MAKEVLYIFAFLLVWTTVYCQTDNTPNEGTETVTPPPVRKDDSAPRNFTVTEVEKGLNFTWMGPGKPGSISSYSIVYADDKGIGRTVRIKGSETRHLLLGIKPWTSYTFFLIALTVNNGIAEASSPAVTTIKTRMAAPGKPGEINVISVTSTSVHLSWTEPTELNGILGGYNVTYTPVENNDTLLTNTTDAEILGLRPYTPYSVFVSAYNVENEQVLLGEKVDTVIWTDTDKPSKVVNLTVSYATKTSVEVVWEAPETPNGPIDYYTVSYQGPVILQKQNTTNTTFLFTDLNPGIKALVIVKACNQENELQCSDKSGIDTWTHNDVPSSVAELSVKSSTGTSVELIWSRPLAPNGPISGYIVYEGDRSFTTTARTFVVENLKPAKKYVFGVSAFNPDSVKPNSRLEGLQSTVRGNTSAIAPPRPKPLTHLSSGRTSIDFNFTKPLFSNENGPVKEWVLLVATGDVMALNGSEGTDIKQEFKTWNKFNRSKEMYRASPVDWSLEKDNDICRTLNSALICTVGSKNNCKKDTYCNAALEMKTKYRFKIRAYTEGGWSETNAIEATTAAGPVLTASFGLLVIHLAFNIFGFM